MAQATPICPHSAELCRLRVTALNPDGTVADGPNNSYVTDSPIQLAVTPEIKAGASTDVTNGCGCVCVTRRTPDQFLRWDLSLQLCAVEPALTSLLIGASLHEDASDIPVPIGWDWPQPQSCDSPTLVAIEAWSEAWEYDAQHAAPNQWIYWLFLSAQFHIDNYTLADGFMLPQFAGVTKSNDQWGVGPYGDIAVDFGPAGGVVWTNTIPDADCAFETVGSGS
jgi:hypothetical protein